MKISIISIDVTTKQSKAGKPYQNAEVIYKNLDSGKVENKNVNQYQGVFKKVAESGAGQVFSITSEKNDGGFWEWKTFERSTADATPATNTPTPVATSKAGGTWETPEERAKKQVYIVKQSSLSNALSTLSMGAKTTPTKEAVIELAQFYTDWVFADKKQDIFEQANDFEVE